MAPKPLREPTSLSFTSAEETVVEGAKVFRTLDLFSGYGGNSLGLIGYTDTVAYCESDPHAVAVLKSRMRDGLLPQAEVHRDVTTLSAKELPEDIDLIVGGFPCFTGDTLVFTETGYRPIRDIKVGELVLTHKRRWRKVTQAHITESRRLRRIKGLGFIETLTTDEHPFYARAASSSVQESSREVVWQHSEPGFVDAKDTLGLYLGTTYPPDLVDDPPLKSSYLYYLGKELVAAGNPIANNLLVLPIRRLSTLLSGVLSGSIRTIGDSGLTTEEIRVSSLELALTIQMALLKCYGTLASVERLAEASRTSYRVLFTCGDKSCYFTEYSVGWSPCSLSESTELFDTVYNIAVEEDESYLANGYLVHNCQDISCAGKGEGIVEGNRSGLFFQIMRLADEIRPRFIFLENVPAIRTRGLDTVLRGLTERGYDCRWTMLSAAQVGAPHKRERWFLLAALRSGLAPESGRIAPYSDCFGQQGQPLSPDSEGAGQFWKNWTVAHPEDCGDRGELRVLSIKNGQISESEESQDLCHEPVHAGKDSSPLANSHYEGLQECGQPGLAELQAKGGSRVDSGPQHTGEAVAHTHGQRIGPNAGTVSGEQDEGHEAWGYGSSYSCPDATDSLAHPHQRGLPQEGPGQSPTGSSGGHETRTGSAKPGLGGVADGSSSGLDQGLPGYLSRSYWKEEPEGIPRTTQEREQRTSRIKRLGNGVVPLQARIAFEYLMWGDADG